MADNTTTAIGMVGGMTFLSQHMAYLIPYLTFYFLVAINGVFGIYRFVYF